MLHLYVFVLKYRT